MPENDGIQRVYLKNLLKSEIRKFFDNLNCENSTNECDIAVCKECLEKKYQTLIQNVLRSGRNVSVSRCILLCTYIYRGDRHRRMNGRIDERRDITQTGLKK